MKKILTNDIIKNDLLSERTKSGIVILIFLIVIVGVLLTTLFVVKWKPWVIIGSIAIILVSFGFFKMYQSEQHKKVLIQNEEFNIKEEQCIKKEKEMGEKEGRSDYYIYFGEKYPISVSEKFFDATNEGDMFYVIYMNGNPDPRLHYNQNEWMLDR